MDLETFDYWGYETTPHIYSDGDAILIYCTYLHLNGNNVYVNGKFVVLRDKTNDNKLVIILNNQEGSHSDVLIKGGEHYTEFLNKQNLKEKDLDGDLAKTNTNGAFIEIKDHEIKISGSSQDFGPVSKEDYGVIIKTLKRVFPNKEVDTSRIKYRTEQ